MRIRVGRRAGQMQASLGLAFVSQETAAGIQKKGEYGHLKPVPEFVELGIAEKRLAGVDQDEDGAARTGGRRGMRQFGEGAGQRGTSTFALHSRSSRQVRVERMPDAGAESEIHG